MQESNMNIAFDNSQQLLVDIDFGLCINRRPKN